MCSSDGDEPNEGFVAFINNDHSITPCSSCPSFGPLKEQPLRSRRRQLAIMSHSTPATYLVWSLLSSLVGLIPPLPPFLELGMTDVLLPLFDSWGYF
jgi:hypothetical protein